MASGRCVGQRPAGLSYFDIFKWLYLAYVWVYLHQTWDFVKLGLHFMTTNPRLIPCRSWYEIRK